MPAMQRAFRFRAFAPERGREAGLVHPIRVVASLLLLSAAVSARAAPAPRFELPRLDGRGSVSSDQLFSTHDHTFLVFWWSGCPHCLESLQSCESFHREQANGEAAVVGIDAEETDLFTARAVVEASGTSFLQLRDPGGAVAAAYGLPSGTPSVCLVGRQGEILDVRIDPAGDLSATMRILRSQAEGRVPPATPEPQAPPGTATGNTASPLHGIAISGWQRIRFRSIDTHGGRPTGPYGEPLEPGNSLDYRLEVEGTKRLRRGLRVGGLLRIGNEGAEVLDTGPKYFGSEWGSAFAAYDASKLGVRVGYFTIFMTPLTLMRWDWDDSPRTGGSSGCACGAAGGMLRIESLDDLTPDLTFEGGLARFDSGEFEARAFYAIPRRALRTTFLDWRTGGDPRAHYTQQLYALDARWQRRDARTRGFWRAGLHLAGTWEDRRSVDLPALGYPAIDPWTQTLVTTATAQIPLFRFVHLRGEIVAWNPSEEHVALPDGRRLDIERDGGGGVGGIVFERSEDLVVKLDYLRLDGDYQAPFAALSYEPDQEGVRISARLPLWPARAGTWLFYKRTREVDPPSMATALEQRELWGVELDARAEVGLGASAGWIDDHRWRSGDAAGFESRHRVLTAGLSWDFDKLGIAELQYQHTSTDETGLGVGSESVADLYIVQTTLDF